MDDVPGTACANAGLKKRCKYTENGKIAYVRIRLESDVFNTEKYLPSMVDMTITLERASPAFCLMAGAQNYKEFPDPDFKVEIINPILWVTKVKPLSSVLEGLNKDLTLSTASYKLRREVIHAYPVSEEFTFQSIENVFNGSIPVRIKLGFVKSTAISGSYGENPWNFEHCNVSKLSVEIEGKSYPTVPYQPNYTTTHHLRE